MDRCNHIVEIIRRSDQGVLRPFLCTASDGEKYWVKGANAGKKGLCCEWIAGRIAQLLELPIPHFKKLYVSEDLIDSSIIEQVNDLGSGIVFGSRHIETTQEFSYELLNKVSDELKFKILLFDWWVKNSDRTLGVFGGNPNLLWDISRKKLIVIDHNLAFEDNFSLCEFQKNHVFYNVINSIEISQLLDFKEKMVNNIIMCSDFFKELPVEWKFFDEDCTCPCGIEENQLCSDLSRVITDFEKDWGVLNE